jgi:hypothetical protein
MVDVNPVVDFWLDVKRQLQTEFGMSADEGRAALDGYRRRMASVGALDAVYLGGPRDVARTTHGGRFAWELLVLEVDAPTPIS